VLVNENTSDQDRGESPVWR